MISPRRVGLCCCVYWWLKENELHSLKLKIYLLSNEIGESWLQTEPKAKKEHNMRSFWVENQITVDTSLPLSKETFKSPKQLGIPFVRWKQFCRNAWAPFIKQFGHRGCLGSAENVSAQIWLKATSSLHSNLKKQFPTVYHSNQPFF